MFSLKFQKDFPSPLKFSIVSLIKGKLSVFQGGYFVHFNTYMKQSQSKASKCCFTSNTQKYPEKISCAFQQMSTPFDFFL